MLIASKLATDTLGAVILSAPDPILIVDDAGTVAFVNVSGERAFGYAAHELVGRPLSVLLPNTDPNGVDGSRTRVTAIHRDGRHLLVDATFGELEDDQDRRLVSTFLRIVSTDETTEALAIDARDAKVLRSLAQSITTAVRVQEVMRQIAEGALAISAATGAYVEQVISPDGKVEVVATAGQNTPAIGQRVPFPGSLTEEIIKRRQAVFLLRMHGFGAEMAPYLDKTCHQCSVFVAPLFGNDTVLGALVLMRLPDEPAFDPSVVTRVGTLADLASITLQRLMALAESERRRAEAEAAVRSRDEVLSVVSHDLRNPVSTVSMSASLLADASIVLTGEQQQAQLGIIARSAQRMNRLIQDLLDVARIEGGRFTISCRCHEAQSLATEAYESFRNIAREKSLELRCVLDDDLPCIYADRDRILQVLANYLNNALKFTPPGGHIVLMARRTEGGGVRYEVHDTGAGIKPADLGNVFTRFWQAKRTAHLGSGLGLAIARGIAEAHRGRVWAESREGKGSVFFLELPLSKECP